MAASPDEVMKLADKVLTDADFRDWFFTNPEKAAESEKVILSEAAKDFVLSLDRKAVDALAAEYTAAKGEPPPPEGIW